MPITSIAELVRRLWLLSGVNQHEVRLLWRRGFMAEAIAYVEARTGAPPAPAGRM